MNAVPPAPTFSLGGFRRWLLLPCVLLMLCGAAAGQGAAPAPVVSSPPQNILLLYAYGYGGRGVELFSEGFFRAVTEAGFPVTQVYAEYLDLQRHRDLAGYRAGLRELLRHKYAQRRIDLIVTLQQPALKFLLEEGRELAPDAPVITIQQNPLTADEAAGRRIVGEVIQFDIQGTLARALELFPQTRRMVFVGGSSLADATLTEEVLRVAKAWQGRLAFETTTGKTLDEILQRVAQLPPHSLIVFTQYNTDPQGRVMLAYEAERRIVQAANAPVFGFYDYNLRNGGIGGAVIPVEDSGYRTGRLALAILRGEDAGETGTLHTGESVPMFDWRQIERWGGDASRLPANAVFVNRPPSAWQEHGAIIVATLLFIAAESVLIAMLVASIRRRQRAERGLAENEAKLHAMFNCLPDAIVFANAERHILMVNPAFTRLFGYESSEVAGRTTEFLYADAADYAEQGRYRFNAAALATADGAYPMRYRRKDGSEFWAESTGSRIVGPDGALTGLLGMHRDITARRAAELALVAGQARLRQLTEIVETIAGVRKLDDLMVLVRHAVRDLTGADGATLVLLENGDCHYVDEEAIEPLWKGHRFPIEQCISGWAIQHAQPVVIEDVFVDERIPHDEYRATFVKSLAIMPVGRHKPLGAIGCYWASQHRATNEELELQQALADAMAVALDNLTLFRELTSATQAAEHAANEARENAAALAVALAEQRSARQAALNLMEDAQVARRRAEENNAELARFNKAMIDREVDMIAMKIQINAMSQELGRAPPYPLEFLKEKNGGETP